MGAQSSRMLSMRKIAGLIRDIGCADLYCARGAQARSVLRGWEGRAPIKSGGNGQSLRSDAIVGS